MRVLGVWRAGGVLAGVVPVPGSGRYFRVAAVLGALKAGLVRLEQVREAAGFLIAVFPLLFVPGAVGIMELGELLAGIWLPVLLAVSLVTVLVMAAAGWAAQAVIRRKGARHG